MTRMSRQSCYFKKDKLSFIINQTNKSRVEAAAESALTYSGTVQLKSGWESNSSLPGRSKVGGSSVQVLVIFW